MAKATKLIALLAGQAVGAAAAIAIGLLDPAMDRCRVRLELPGQILNVAPAAGQRNNLLPEFRRVRLWALKTGHDLLQKISNLAGDGREIRIVHGHH